MNNLQSECYQQVAVIQLSTLYKDIALELNKVTYSDTYTLLAQQSEIPPF